MEFENTAQQNCRNCETLIKEDGKYCMQCGQRYTTGHVTLWKLLNDLFQSFISIDSKLIKTFLTLFVPGKLTVAYFKGRHKTYAAPVRVFFWGTLVLITSLGVQINEQKNTIEINSQSRKDDWRTHQLLERLVNYKAPTVEKFENRDLATQVVDTFLHFATSADSVYEDSITLNVNMLGSSELKIASKDIFELTPNQIIERYKIQGFWNKLIKRQEIKITQEVEAGTLNFVDIAIQRATPLLFVCIPFFALFLKLLYIRRNRYYVEHFIFTMHVNAFVFLFLALSIALNSDWAEVIEDIIPFGLMIYIVVAMKNVYEQSWGKTVLKFGISMIGYFVSLGIAAILVTFLSILLY
jgi:hypothetical protein